MEFFFISVCDWDLGLCYVLLYMHRTCLDMLLCDLAQMESVGLNVSISASTHLHHACKSNQQNQSFQTDYLP